MIEVDDLFPHARWTDDCQGKQDFDGGIISVSTRYWPGPEGAGIMLVAREPEGGVTITTIPYGPRPSANSSIILRLGPAHEHDGGGEYLVWREQDFEADSEAEVKALVEHWVCVQMREVVAALGGLSAFRKP